ncbi:MAG: recombinase family protein [Clostridia bacterium]|nr:recombinase family protein [Clostridia bacterium]
MKIYGYVRVSSKDQNEERQMIAMKNYGVDSKNIVLDKQSGKDFKRQGYMRLIRKMKPGDLLVVKSIDRLGRNYDEILEQWRKITKEKQCDVVVLDMPLLDTRRDNENLTKRFVADLVLQILSYVAQNERELIRQRQREGIEAAKMRGVKFGRRPKPLPEDFQAVAKECQEGKLSVHAGARKLQMPYSTFAKKYKKC